VTDSPRWNVIRKGNDMNDTVNDPAARATNVVVLRGAVRGERTERELPSGSIVVQFDVATALAADGRHRSVSVPVAWVDPIDAALVVEGAEVVITGTVRRRFFRVGGATQSRTEVVADAVIPVRRRAQVARALEAVADRLVR
jgi:single-strand DNA-binding protein